VCGSLAARLGRIAAVHFHAPSIDQGVIAFLWAIALGTYLYFFLVAVGSSGDFAFVISALSAFGIWLFVRTRGADATSG
jgi:hypothetical protein